MGFLITLKKAMYQVDTFVCANGHSFILQGPKMYI